MDSITFRVTTKLLLTLTLVHVVLAIDSRFPFCRVSNYTASCDVSVRCSCCLDGRCNSGTDFCVGDTCKNGYWGGKCTESCPVECISCHRNFQFENHCFNCSDGHYGKVCSLNCSEGCKVCNKDTGHCEECITGRYAQTCSKICSKGCKNSACDQKTGNCLECNAGYFEIKTCNLTCPSNCKDKLCEIQAGTCSAGCVNRFHGNNCSKTCPSRCNNGTCQQHTGECSSCKLGYYGAFCNVKCPKHCNWDICDRKSGYCFACIDGYYGVNCSKSCPANCMKQQCDQTNNNCTNGCNRGFTGDLCDTCISGKYGDGCNKSCSFNCLNSECRQEDGSCTRGCKPGHSDTYFCCANNDNCKHCASSTECTECIPGTYGTLCEKNCSIDCNGTCEKSTGVCSECKLNRYGLMCEHHCSRNCKPVGNLQSQCYPNNGSCVLGCNDNYHGDTCNLRCSTACNGTCKRENGECDNCKGNNYGTLCEFNCPSSCLHNADDDVTCSRENGTCMFGCPPYIYGSKCGNKCSKACNGTCDGHTGKCFDCFLNTYGPFCQYVCSTGCVQDKHGNISSRCLEKNGTCILGCNDNFYGAKCDSECSTTCSKRCDKQSGKCDNCNGDTFGTFCDHDCSDGCIQNRSHEAMCFRETGTCKFGCQQYFYGNRCENKCSVFCNGSCDQRNGNCLDCKLNRYGSHCQYNCSESCLQYINDTSIPRCHSNNGSCVHGCDDKYYGEKCDHECSPFCGGICERSNGRCVSCIGNSFGDICEHSCSNGCLLDKERTASCFRENGTCTRGCEPDLYGSTCEMKCSKACNGSCERQTGHCYSCVSNTFGLMCENNCSEGCVQQSNETSPCSETTGTCAFGCLKGFSGDTCIVEDADSDTSIIAPVVGGSIGAVVVIAMVIAGAVYFLRKRNYGNGNKENIEPEHIYDEIDSTELQSQRKYDVVRPNRPTFQEEAYENTRIR